MLKLRRMYTETNLTLNSKLKTTFTDQCLIDLLDLVQRNGKTQIIQYTHLTEF